jgi:mannose-6-phosphate isomerase-like protein (cupin superfamily)
MTTDLFERLKQASVFIRSPDGNTGSGYLIASAAHCFVRAEAERVRSTEATLDLLVYRSADRAVGHVAATEGGVGNGGGPASSARLARGRAASSRADDDRKMTMELEKGITRNGEGFAGVRWNILGQSYFPKAVCGSAFAFEANSDPGQFVPVHIHPTQDEFILVQEGELSLKLDGVWSVAKAGDLVRMPRGIPHGYFNKSDKPARALFWVSPAGKLEDLPRDRPIA